MATSAEADVVMDDAAIWSSQSAAQKNVEPEICTPDTATQDVANEANAEAVGREQLVLS